MAVDRAVKMHLSLDLDPQKAKAAASNFGIAMKTAMTGAFTTAIAYVGTQTRAFDGIKKQVGEIFSKAQMAGGVVGKAAGAVMTPAGGAALTLATGGTGAGAINAAAAMSGRSSDTWGQFFKRNLMPIAGGSIGGLIGGAPGAMAGSAAGALLTEDFRKEGKRPNADFMGPMPGVKSWTGRGVSAAMGAGLGTMAAGPLGGVAGAVGGAVGGPAGAVLASGLAGAASAAITLTKAALDAANGIASMVELTDPATAREWNRALTDATAIMGDMLKPVLEFAIDTVRQWADVMAGSGDGFKDAIGAIVDIVKVVMIPTMATFKVLMPVVSLALKGLAAVVQVLLWPLKKLGEGIDWVISKIPFLGGSKDASRGVASHGQAGFDSIEGIARRAQEAGLRAGKLSVEERQLLAMEEVARNTRKKSRVNEESLGGQR